MVAGRTDAVAVHAALAVGYMAGAVGHIAEAAAVNIVAGTGCSRTLQEQDIVGATETPLLELGRPRKRWEGRGNLSSLSRTFKGKKGSASAEIRPSHASKLVYQFA